MFAEFGCEVHSTGLDVSTEGRDVTVIFGDGAGAVILEANDDEPLDPRLTVGGLGTLVRRHYGWALDIDELNSAVTAP